jgi:hypothetical protein
VLDDLAARGIPYTVLRGGVEERARRVREVLDGVQGDDGGAVVDSRVA